MEQFLYATFVFLYYQKIMVKIDNIKVHNIQNKHLKRNGRSIHFATSTEPFAKRVEI
jgi:hypothetical protein